MAGRNSKYATYVKPYLDDIVKWKWDGLKESDICKKLGVSVSSFELYKTQHSELKEAIERGNKKIADIAENSLFDIIKGHYVEDTKTIVDTADDGKKRTRVETTKRWVDPQAGAVIFTLRNKRPLEYRDTRHTELSGAVKTENPYKALTTEELKELAKLGVDDEQKE